MNINRAAIRVHTQNKNEKGGISLFGYFGLLPPC